MEELANSSSVFVRICPKCFRPMRGYGHKSLYGHFWQEWFPSPPGEHYLVKVHCCGEGVHIRCPPPNAAQRQPKHDYDGGSAGKARNISKGIDLLSNGRYVARANKNTRLGTFDTYDQAQAALAAYAATLKKEK